MKMVKSLLFTKTEEAAAPEIQEAEESSEGAEARENRGEAERTLEERAVWRWYQELIEGCAGAPLSRLSLLHWDQENSCQYRGVHWFVLRFLV